jgi:hypothetical protein
MYRVNVQMERLKVAAVPHYWLDLPAGTKELAARRELPACPARGRVVIMVGATT